MISILKKFLNKILFFSFENLNKFLSIKLINLILTLKKREHFFGYCEEKKLYFVRDNLNKHFFSNRQRGFGLYYQGLKSRRDQLKNSYKLNHISFKKNDLVIDCGANYGDLWLFLKDKINSNNYISFEPGINEYKSLICNAPNSQNINQGLGDSNKFLDFYVNEKAEVLRKYDIQKQFERKPIKYDSNSTGEIEELVRKIETSGVSIARSYDEYLNIGIVFYTECGELGREYFHRVCRLDPKYKSEDCDDDFDKIIRYNYNSVTIGTLIHKMKEYGVI